MTDKKVLQEFSNHDEKTDKLITAEFIGEFSGNLLTNETEVSDDTNKEVLSERVKKRYQYRDAETGEFVSEEYAIANQKTTVREQVD